MAETLHVIPGDEIGAEVADVAGVDVADLVPWRDVLHDGPVPAWLPPDELARVRAAHLATRGWTPEAAALKVLTERDDRVASHPDDAPVVLWFEQDLYCALQLAQVSDRLAGRSGPVWLVDVPQSEPRGLSPAYEQRIVHEPNRHAFAALRSDDPRAWLDVPAFGRLVEELPDVASGLSRLEREILEALRPGPLPASELFAQVSALEQPPWIADAPLWAVADDLAPLVGRAVEGTYAITRDGVDVLRGRADRPRVSRWLGGVELGPGRPDWRYDSNRRLVVVVGPA